MQVQERIARLTENLARLTSWHGH